MNTHKKRLTSCKEGQASKLNYALPPLITFLSTFRQWRSRCCLSCYLLRCVYIFLLLLGLILLGKSGKGSQVNEVAEMDTSVMDGQESRDEVIKSRLTGTRQGCDASLPMLPSSPVQFSTCVLCSHLPLPLSGNVTVNGKSDSLPSFKHHIICLCNATKEISVSLPAYINLLSLPQRHMV